ncbi:hypothetical protein PVK06_030263 [Gossypium arboreum]|uniref:Uncharacterized protein n=1 Tax=Gossypium arboreum TaxID=29729 RepID=A0ABR0NMT9_GOSAR|nr:hypothetical protein PVK06_030263 [Gossypium arboreum]
MKTASMPNLSWLLFRMSTPHSSKASLQKNFTRPILDFPTFPKELLPLFEVCCAKRELVEVSSKKEEFATREDKVAKGQASEEEPEKIKSLTIKIKEEAQKETALTSK